MPLVKMTRFFETDHSSLWKEWGQEQERQPCAHRTDLCRKCLCLFLLREDLVSVLCWRKVVSEVSLQKLAY